MGIISPQENFGGVLNVNTTAVGNVGIGADDLITYSLPGGTLNQDGRMVRVTAWGTTAANANNKAVSMWFGASEVSALSAAINDAPWRIEMVIVRTGAATQNGIGWNVYGTNNAAPGYSSPTETLSGAITIKCTGTATSDNDIVQRGMIVEVLN